MQRWCHITSHPLLFVVVVDMGTADAQLSLATVLSFMAFMLETTDLQLDAAGPLEDIEAVIGAMFTIELALRVACAPAPKELLWVRRHPRDDDGRCFTLRA